MHKQFLEANALIVGALAWAGYLSKNRGAVVIYASQKGEDARKEGVQADFGYLSKEETVQNYREGRDLHQFVDEYDPYNGMVVTFADIDATLDDSCRITLTPPPPKCYVLLQEQLLEQNIGGNNNN